MKIGVGGNLRKTHEHEFNRQAGTATLTRVNPCRDYGRNIEWNGKGEKIGETDRVLVQRLHGTDIHYFFTGDGMPLSRPAIPQYILDDIKVRPLVSEMGGNVDTVAICKVCGEPQPASLYPQHLEEHLLGTATAVEAEDREPEVIDTDDEDDPAPARPPAIDRMAAARAAKKAKHAAR